MRNRCGYLATAFSISLEKQKQCKYKAESRSIHITHNKYLMDIGKYVSSVSFITNKTVPQMCQVVCSRDLEVRATVPNSLPSLVEKTDKY